MTTKNNAKVANVTKGRQRIDRRQHHPMGTERSTSETGNKTLRFVLDSNNRLMEEDGGGGGGKSAPNLCARAIVHVELSNRSSDVESSLAVSPDGTIAHLRTFPAAWARQSLCDLLYERATNLFSRIVVSASGGGGGATAFGAGASSPLQTVYRVSQLLVAINPDVAAYRTLTADVHMVRGDLQDALREWDHCLRVTPDDSSALAKSALCYVVQGKATIAVDRLVKLVSGGNIDQLEDVVRSMTSDERESVAREALKRIDWRVPCKPASLSFSTLAVVATRREKPGPLRIRATHLGALGRHAEARDELTLCLKLVGENAGDLCGRGCLFSVEGSLEKARKDFLRAFELDARLSVGLLASGPAQDAFRRAFFVRDDGKCRWSPGQIAAV